MSKSFDRLLKLQEQTAAAEAEAAKDAAKMIMDTGAIALGGKRLRKLLAWAAEQGADGVDGLLGVKPAETVKTKLASVGN